jgi:hypothetical protein
VRDGVERRATTGVSLIRRSRAVEPLGPTGSEPLRG